MNDLELKSNETARDHSFNCPFQTIIDVPSDDKVNVTGTCASGNETESSITITPKSGPLKSLTFDFKINKKTEKSELVTMSAEVMVDGKSRSFFGF